MACQVQYTASGSAGAAEVFSGPLYTIVMHPFIFSTLPPMESQARNKILVLLGYLGDSAGYASAFGSRHDLQILGSSPTWGSLLSGELASPPPSASFPPSPTACALSLSNE